MKLRVLIFEDDENIRQLLWTLSDRRGYETFTFPDPGLCPLHVADTCPCSGSETCADVIISDLKMPNVDGINFIKGMKKKGCKCHHIALMSGSLTENDMLSVNQIGVKLLKKPFELKELIEWFEEIEKSIDEDRKLAAWFIR